MLAHGKVMPRHQLSRPEIGRRIPQQIDRRGPRLASEVKRTRQQHGDGAGNGGGDVKIKLRPDLAPGHVERIKELAGEGFYDGVKFHRVIDGFMAQTGDPTGTGTGGMGETLNAEFSKEPHSRGAVSMARTTDLNSARSQFFIVFKDSNFLDGQYTVWGKVTSGMEFVDKIKKGAPGSGAVSTPPDKMIKVQVAADAKS